MEPTNIAPNRNMNHCFICDSSVDTKKCKRISCEGFTCHVCTQEWSVFLQKKVGVFEKGTTQFQQMCPTCSAKELFGDDSSDQEDNDQFIDWDRWYLENVQ